MWRYSNSPVEQQEIGGMCCLMGKIHLQGDFLVPNGQYEKHIENILKLNPMCKATNI